MERVRVAGIIKINGGYAFMHRKNVKKKKRYTRILHISRRRTRGRWNFRRRSN